MRDTIDIPDPQHLVERLALDPALTADVLDRLVFERGFPLTSDRVATFAYRGGADSVRLLHFGIGLPDNLEFERREGSDWWLLTLGLPNGTRLEYQLEVTEWGQSRLIEDPLNPFEARNPFGQNSVCRAHGYAVPPWALNDPASPPGLQRSLAIRSGALDRPVPVTLYLPASFSMEPEHRYPLLILHDGTDYLHHAAASTVLDNLIHRGLVPEFVVAFCDPRDRLTEYADDERHARFVAEELVPYLESHLPLIGGADARCLGGASFGAVATLSTAARYPDMFGRLLLQSGSFAGASDDCVEPADTDIWAPVYEFVQRFKADPKKVADKVFMSCGVMESMISENRAMHPILKATGMPVVLGEALDGHTWGCWRDLLGIALPWLFADAFRPRDVRPFDPPEAPDNFRPSGSGEIVHG